MIFLKKIVKPSTMFRICLALSIFFVIGLKSRGAYYETLPKGIRLVELRYISTSKINSAFTGQKNEKDFNFKLSLDSKGLEGLNPKIKQAMDYLKEISPEAHESLSFGEFEFDANAKVSVRVVAAGYGLTNKTSLYVGVPIYNGEVNIDVKRTKESNVKEAISYLRERGINIDIEVDANKKLIQSVMVNTLQYNPVGHWQAQGLGDIELGVIHRIKSWQNYGIAVSGGVVLPTGEVDDPDTIQDIPFGDGQIDLFAEIGGGYQFLSFPLSFDTFFRYTYQLPHTRTMRIAENPDYKELAESKGEFYEKLGDKYDFTFLANIFPTDWLRIGSGISYSQQLSASYKSEYSTANQILAVNTEKESVQLRAGIGLSTINKFKAGKFFLPMSLNLEGRHVISGRNTPKYNRIDLELRFFF